MLQDKTKVDKDRNLRGSKDLSQINPNKLELNRLRLNRMQLKDSKRIITNQVQANPATKMLRLNSINSGIASIDRRIHGLKRILGIFR